MLKTLIAAAVGVFMASCTGVACDRKFSSSRGTCTEQWTTCNEEHEQKATIACDGSHCVCELDGQVQATFDQGSYCDDSADQRYKEAQGCNPPARMAF